MAISPADAARVVRAAGLGSHLTVPSPTMDSMAGMTSMPGMRSMAGMTTHPMAPAMARMTHGYDVVGMVAAHLVAAVLCGLWLAYGERAVFRIGRVLAARLFAPVRLILWSPRPPHRPRVRADVRAAFRCPRSQMLAHAITTRGPPAGARVIHV